MRAGYQEDGAGPRGGEPALGHGRLGQRGKRDGEYLPFDPLGLCRSRGRGKEVRDGKRTTTRGDREGEAGGLT